MPNDRSDAALRERLEIAEKAVPKGEKTIWTADFASPHETCVRDAFTERILTMEDYTDQATAAHIAANHPDVVRADIEEILRLRKERDWLLREIVNTSDRQFCPMPNRYECLYHVGHECKSREVEMRVGCWRTAVECAVRYEEEKNNAE